MPEISLTLQENLFVRKPVPRKGIVCSNYDRASRLARDFLHVFDQFRCSWGAEVWIGTYVTNDHNEHDHRYGAATETIFVAVAPVGSGSGLVFTELFSAGAEYLVRYGSDDVKNPEEYEYSTIKLIDETDNLYGFNEATGVPESEWGQSVLCSPVLLQAFSAEALKRRLPVETRLCHHLENYHSLRNPHVYPNRVKVLEDRLEKLKEKAKAKGKKESFDMESAVLFRVAQDWGKHALSVLQTVNKETVAVSDPYEGELGKKARAAETALFVDYIFTALLSISQ